MEKNKNVFKNISTIFSIVSIIIVFISIMVYDESKGVSEQTGLSFMILSLFAIYWKIIANPIFLLIVLIGSSVYISKNEEKGINIASLINILATSLIYIFGLRNIFTTGGFYETVTVNTEEIIVKDKTTEIFFTSLVILAIEFVVYLVVNNRLNNKENLS